MGERYFNPPNWSRSILSSSGLKNGGPKAGIVIRRRVFGMALIFQILSILFLVNVLSVKGEARSLVSDVIIASKGLGEGIRSSVTSSSRFSNPSSDLVSCRNGVVARGPEQAAWVDDLGAGWYVLFGDYSGLESFRAESAPVIDVRQKKDGSGNYLHDFIVNPPLTEESLGNLVRLFPGKLWLVGNEVDRGPNPDDPNSGQGDTLPWVYSHAYHEVYHFIKDRDPTAQVAISGLVEVTPGRLQYLDIVWDTYKESFGVPMPVDVWNMHLYILPEVMPNGTPNGIASVALGTDPGLGIRESGDDPNQCAKPNVYCIAEHDDLDEFDYQIRAMRNWMLRHDQRDKPLMLSEYSIIYPYIDDGETCYLQDEFGNCFTEDRVLEYMTRTTNYLRAAKDPLLGNPLDSYRLIQQTAWFSVNNDGRVGDVSNLVERSVPDGPLTSFSEIGNLFINHAMSDSLYVNLSPAPLKTIAAHIIDPATSVTVTLDVDIANNGTIPLTETFKITFYENIQPTKEIGSVLISPAELPGQEIPGCARRQLNVNVKWSGLTAGVHPYWVEIDSENEVGEIIPGGDGEGDNLAMAYVFVNQERSYIPLIGVRFP